VSAPGGPLVEILYFDGCPKHEPAITLVEQLRQELGVEPDLRLINVATKRPLSGCGSSARRRSGSAVSTVDPRTQEQTDFALACRVFQTDAGMTGQPDPNWVREGLLRGAATS
jgi:hypothetical protein